MNKSRGNRGLCYEYDARYATSLTPNIFQETIGILVVDNVLEAIRIGMEINQPHYNQRRVAEAKLLGELYNYRMVESNIIFNTLYLVISFGSLPDCE